MKQPYIKKMQITENVLNQELLKKLVLLANKDIKTTIEFQINHNLQYFGETMERFDERGIVKTKQDARALAIALSLYLNRDTIEFDTTHYTLYSTDFYPVQQQEAVEKLIRFAEANQDALLKILLFNVASRLEDQSKSIASFLEKSLEENDELANTLTLEEKHLLVHQNVWYRTFGLSYKELILSYLNEYPLESANAFNLLNAMDLFLEDKLKKADFTNKDQFTRLSLLASMFRKDMEFSEKVRQAFGWDRKTYYEIYFAMVCEKAHFRNVPYKITKPGFDRIYLNSIKEKVLNGDPQENLAALFNKEFFWTEESKTIIEERPRTIANWIPGIKDPQTLTQVIAWLDEKHCSWESRVYNSTVEGGLIALQDNRFTEGQKCDIFNHICRNISKRFFIERNSETVSKEQMAQLEQYRKGFEKTIGELGFDYFVQLVKNNLINYELPELIKVEECREYLFRYLREINSPNYVTILRSYPIEEIKDLFMKHYEHAKKTFSLTKEICDFYLDCIELESGYTNKLISALLDDNFVLAAEISEAQKVEVLRYLLDQQWVDSNEKETVLKVVATEQELKAHQLKKRTAAFKEEFGQKCGRSYYDATDLTDVIDEYLDLFESSETIRDFVLDSLNQQAISTKGLMKLLFIKEMVLEYLTAKELKKWTAVIRERVQSNSTYCKMNNTLQFVS